MKVELVFDSDCPHVGAARSNVAKALAHAGLPVDWKEWVRTSAQTPERLRGFGSPAILIDGIDVTGEPPAGSACCRVYRTADGQVFGAPTVEMVGKALRTAKGSEVSPHS